MVKKTIVIITILLCVVLCFAGTHDPWDGTKWDVASPDIDQPHGNAYKEIYDLRKGVAARINKEHETLATSSAGGVHKQGSARAFFQDAAPTTQVNGDAFDSGDLGSFWFDSNADPDNQFNVLTATTPTWTPISTEIIAVLLASNRTFAGTLTVTGESTFNNHVNLGAGDDLIGSSTSDITINTNKFTVAGATGNTVIGGTGTVGGTLDVTGNIDPTSYETTNGGFLDEDAMDSDSATKVASQQSIKAFGKAHGYPTVNGTGTAVFTKFFTGTLDADASTSVAHSVTSGATKILACSVAMKNSGGGAQVFESYAASSADNSISVSFNDTNVVFASVGANFQGQFYRIKIDYIL